MRSRVSIVAAALALAACSTGEHRLNAQSARSYAASGLASWYGEELSGNRTASGERFDPSAITAAHRTLPLGSFVEVTALDTGRSIIVRVNDRGPGRGDRLIDLSRGAAQQLGFGRRSVAQVRVRAVQPSPLEIAAFKAGVPAPMRQGGVVPVASLAAAPSELRIDRNRHYLLQIASFSNEARARALAGKLDADVVSTGALWRVRLGPIVGQDVQRARDGVAARGYGDAQILPAD